METALYANNMVCPEAVLDSRQVLSDPTYIVSTFSKHNSTPRGTIALIDTRMGKNDPNAVFNFSDPKNPTRDTGEACDPYPVTKDLILFSDRNGKKNAIFLIKRNKDDSLTRELLISDPAIGPTNNVAEQAIRFVAIHRRMTQGTRGKVGQAWFKRICTVVVTCQQQGRSTLEFIAESVGCFLCRQSAPSLLPPVAADTS